MTKYMMVACPTLKQEIESIMEDNGLDYPVFYLPHELHLQPDNLRAYLQDFIPRVHHVDYLILPMGKCGNGTIGIPTGTCTLVLPKCEDCINLLLAEKSIADVDRPKYMYFFTESWLDYRHSFTNEYLLTVEKYGQERADMVTKMMYTHYRYFGYVDTGYGDFESAKEKVEPLSKVAETEIIRLPAHLNALRRMVCLDFDENFLLVPPGQTVTREMFG